jgi:hypothetical protein
MLLAALKRHPELAAMANSKVLSLTGSVIAARASPGPSPVPLNACIRKLAQVISSHKEFVEEAVKLCKSAAPSAIIAAALLDAATEDTVVRDVVASAYIDGIVGCKDRLPDSTADTWRPVVARLTTHEAAAALAKLAVMTKRCAETALTNSAALLSSHGPDLSSVAPLVMDTLTPLLRHSKDAVIARAAAALPPVATRFRDAGVLADAALTLVGILDGSAPGGKAKSSRERALVIAAVRGMAPSATDRSAARRRQGNVRAATLRVAAALATAAMAEATTDSKAAALSAAEVWVRAGAAATMFGMSGHVGEAGALSLAADVVSAAATAAAAKEADVRRAALGAGAAIAADPTLAVALLPLAAAAAAAVRQGAAKAALRTEGLMGLCIVAAAAGHAAGADADTAWALCGSVGAVLLTPQALATAPVGAAYAAVAVVALLEHGPRHAVSLHVAGASLAALALGNAPFPRAVALAVAPRAAAAAHAAATATWNLLESFPAIPGTEAPNAAATGEGVSHTGGSVLAPRVAALAGVLAPYATSCPALVVDLLLALHHPALVANTHTRHTTEPARRLLTQHGLTSLELLSPVAHSLGERLVLPPLPSPSGNGAVATVHTCAMHAAAQRSLAAVLAAGVDGLWGDCLQVLTRLLDSTDVDALLDNDVRMFETPRGKLMVEVCPSSLALVPGPWSQSELKGQATDLSSGLRACRGVSKHQCLTAVAQTGVQEYHLHLRHCFATMAPRLRYNIPATPLARDWLRSAQGLSCTSYGMAW